MLLNLTKKNSKTDNEFNNFLNKNEYLFESSPKSNNKFIFNEKNSLNNFKNNIIKKFNDKINFNTKTENKLFNHITPQNEMKQEFYKKSKNLNTQTQSTLENLDFLNIKKFFEKNYKIFYPQIGSGNLGKINMVLNVNENVLYACKIMKINNFSKNYDRHKYFIENEIKFWSLISKLQKSKYIIRYKNSWKENLNYYLITELCICSVNDILRNKFVNEYILLKIIKNICKGLIILHNNNFVHMDIKPENILYGFDNKFKLNDFGLSVYRYSKNSVEEGDKRYMAPELLNKNSIIDLSKSDIFSLGLTIYHLMKRIDLIGNGLIFKKWRNNQIDFDSLNYYSQNLKFLIKKMLEKDLNKRPSCFDILIYLKEIKKQLK